MKCLTCHGLITNGNCGCSTGTQGAASVNIDTMLRDRDAEIARLKARAEKAETEVDAIAWERGVIEDRLTQALAACAEMRAALEAVATANTRRLGESRRAIEAARALLSRPDLGAGKVLVEREVLERVRDVLQRLPRAGWGYTDAERAAVVDLDALLKKGGW